ncbi:hypothetical protein DPMN_177315 [Dreissena polymorpha]|uniref:Uncharacterized protein n=1 Tax=Dreissena polymorpha TaxID=45954 RepID=A0A9D4ECT4_DREPO|nr:hypothetical protein DPMN_177315 [Dreissena polymorpha]
MSKAVNANDNQKNVKDTDKGNKTKNVSLDKTFVNTNYTEESFVAVNANDNHEIVKDNDEENNAETVIKLTEKTGKDSIGKIKKQVERNEIKNDHFISRPHEETGYLKDNTYVEDEQNNDDDESSETEETDEGKGKGEFDAEERDGQLEENVEHEEVKKEEEIKMNHAFKKGVNKSVQIENNATFTENNKDKQVKYGHFESVSIDYKVSSSIGANTAATWFSFVFSVCFCLYSLRMK